MPSEVKVPWSRPIADPAATRVPSRIVVPQPADLDADWPYAWSWFGLVNAIQTAPSWYVAVSRDITQFAWTAVTVGTTVLANITRNGSNVLSRTITGGAGSQSDFGTISFTAGQRIGLQVTGVGDGAYQGLWIGVR